LAWIGLNMLPSLTPRRRTMLLEALGGPDRVWRASERILSSVVGPEAAARIAHERTQVDPEAERAQAERGGAHIVTQEDPTYPCPIKGLPAMPPVLYILGTWRPEDSHAVAVVGTRRCTSYGRLVARKFSSELAGRGITVVSGLAPGVDTAAHWGALSSGRTLAVLGTGLGKPYPAGSEALIEAIAASGAVLSEFPWNQGGARWTFPKRNRALAGLAQAVVVVEAGRRSGALITADRALELGREVLAVPGPITSELSVGTNRLIQDGAGVVTHVEDVLDHVTGPPAPGVPARTEQVPLSGDAQRLIAELAAEPLDLSELVARTGLPHARVSEALLGLELGGQVTRTAGGRYSVVP